MVVGEGFEPSKTKSADLQSALVGHLSILPANTLRGQNLAHFSSVCQRALFRNLT
jgi:hypothetical protein